MGGSMKPSEYSMTSGLKDQSGMTLVETMMAILILLVGLLGLAQVLAFDVIASKTYGRDAGKTTASARDKMEQLTGLQFSNASLAAGGSIYPSDPVTGYVDYLNPTGGTTAAGSAAYTRQWQITDVSSTQKTIKVSVTSRRSFRYGIAPSTLLVTVKTPSP